MNRTMELERRLRVNDLFDDLEKEQPQKSRRIKGYPVHKSILDQLIGEFRVFRATFCYTDLGFESCEDILEPRAYPAKVIEEFSLHLNQFEKNDGFDEASGLFLNWYLYHSKDQKFIIHTRQIFKALDYIGRGNKNKHIIVKGNAGIELGSNMEGGKIEVFGNAGSYAGEKMENGELIIRGHAGNHIGSMMRGGRIEVFGNAGCDVGDQGYCGEIHLHGKYSELGGSCGVKIFHEGKLIAE